MKRSFRWLAAFLTLVTVFLIPSNVFASEEKGKYISELAVAEAKSFEEAKEAFEKAGFEIVKESNLNRTLKTGVYLGYKTTDDAEDAIRDAAAMNMQGKYNYGDYKAIMETHKERIHETIENFLPSLEEFQTNYDAGMPKALVAYEALNAYVNSETGEHMGDYFVNYDYSTASETEMTDALMRANTESVLAMMTSIAMGADAEESTLIERLEKEGSDSLEDRYKGMYLTLAKAKQAMEADFGAAADAILAGWNEFYEYLRDTKEDLIITDEEGNMVDVNEAAMRTESGIDTSDLEGETKEYAEGVIGMTELMEDTDKLIAMNLYAMLSEILYDEGTLLDFFMRPADEVEKEELYPLADAMSEGQRAQIAILGLKAILLGGSIDLEEGSDESEEAIENAEETVESMSPVSIFEGTDQSIYEEGVAFTSAATLHAAQTGESWIMKFGSMMTDGDYWSPVAIVSWAVTGLSTLGCIAGVAVYTKLGRDFRKLSDYAEYAQNKFDECASAMSFFKSEAMEVPAELKLEYATWLEERMLAKNNYDSYFHKYAGVRYNSGLAAGICFLIFLVAVAIDVYTIADYFGRQEPTEEAIPHHILSAVETEYGEDYVYYETVKDLNGDPADMNNHEGDKEIGWLVLYTTKEKAAGKPMLAKDLRVVTGRKNVDADSAFLHLFGETAALDVTNELYTGTADDLDGTYVLFDRDISLTGSAVTGGVLAIIALAGAALGFAGGMLVSKFRKKKATAA